MTPRRTPSDEHIRDAFGDVGDALQRALVLSSERVQSVLDDAVLRGRMTRRDAEDLAGHLVALGREQALELRSTLARSVGETVATAGEAVATAHDAVATAVPPLGRRARRSDAPARTNGNGRANGNGHKYANGHVNGHTYANGNGSSNGNVNGRVPTQPSAHTARELIDLAGLLSAAELRALRDRETAGKARATVLRAIDRKLDG